MNTPKNPTPAAHADEAHKPANFLRNVIERDLEAGTYAHRQWGGGAGDAAFHAAGQPDAARVRQLTFPARIGNGDEGASGPGGVLASGVRRVGA